MCVSLPYALCLLSLARLLLFIGYPSVPDILCFSPIVVPDVISGILFCGLAANCSLGGCIVVVR